MATQMCEKKYLEHENDRSPSKRKMDVHLLFKIHSFNMPNLNWLEKRLRTLNGNFAEFIEKNYAKMCDNND